MSRDLRVLAQAHLNTLAAETAAADARNERAAIERALPQHQLNLSPRTVIIDGKAVTMARARVQDAVAYSVSEVVDG